MEERPMQVSDELVHMTIQLLEDVLDDCADKGATQTLLNLWRLVQSMSTK
jgi:hypothetical protein